MTSQTPVILILNFHSSQNAGDAALLEVTVNQLRGRFPGVRMIVAANWPEEPIFHNLGVDVVASPYSLCGVARGIPLWKQIFHAVSATIATWLNARGLMSTLPRSLNAWSPLIHAYRQADLVVTTPGNYLYSTGRWGWPFPLVILPAILAHWHKKPLYALPQSIGPLKRWWERLLLKDAYSNARKVFLRDQVSVELAQEIQLPGQITSLMPDPGFISQQESAEEAASLLRRYGYQGEACIGVTVIARMGHALNKEEVNRYYTCLASSLKDVAQREGLRIYFFNQVLGPSALEDDRLATGKVMSLMELPADQVVEVSEALSPGMLKACYGKMDAFVASRLHSGIFALSMGVPTLFVGYLTKTRGMLQALGLESWLVEIGDDLGAVLPEKLDCLWNSRASYSRQLETILPSIMDSAGQAYSLVAKDYASHA